MPQSRSNEKILSRADLKKQVENWKQKGDSVVFTNGCFDILHLGHVDYLEKARNLGDRLVVGLNTDTSVSRIKGPERPIVGEVSRGRVMAALGFVDAVTFFEEDTPFELINNILPDILVKGSDYLTENIVGADGFSTSSIVNKIKSI